MSIPAKIVHSAKYAAQEVSLRLPKKSDAKSRVAEEIVVSMTSYPARIGMMWKTLETIYRQSVLPSDVVLVLSREEFPGQVLPISLNKYRERGMRVIFVDGNIRSYKKLIPAMTLYSDKTIITADDDVLYPPHWLRDLIAVHESRPSHIVGHRGTVITGKDYDIEPYVMWPQADTRSPTSRVFLTGMGGILYPPNSLPYETTLDMGLAMRLAPFADDMWFKAMSLLAGTPVTKVSDARGDFLTVRALQKSSLRDINVSQGRNEVQFKAVMDHFDLWEQLRSDLI